MSDAKSLVEVIGFLEKNGEFELSEIVLNMADTMSKLVYENQTLKLEIMELYGLKGV